MAKEHDPTNAPDTGHEWDGIRELTNDPPRWWMIGGYITIVFLIAYFVLYPSFPLISDSTKGVLGWTQIKEFNESLEAIEAVRAPYEKKISGMTASQILADAGMTRYAQVSSKVAFGDHCAPCHGSGGQGAPGFPALADDDWLYGGSVDKLVETITEGREGMMPAYAGQLTDAEIDDLVKYVKGLSEGRVHEPGREVFMGRTQSEADCYACHGENAMGDPDMGSANLSDAIFRFDGSEEGIRSTILHGVNTDDPDTREAIMPAFGGKLSESEIRKLAVKVWMFGGGSES